MSNKWILYTTLILVAIALLFTYSGPSEDHATLQVVVSEKRVVHPATVDLSYGEFCQGEACIIELRERIKAGRVIHQYSFLTFVDGKPCAGSVVVKRVTHKCKRGWRFVTEAEWQKLNVGDVLKVVELK